MPAFTLIRPYETPRGTLFGTSAADTPVYRSTSLGRSVLFCFPTRQEMRQPRVKTEHSSC